MTRQHLLQRKAHGKIRGKFQSAVLMAALATLAGSASPALAFQVYGAIGEKWNQTGGASGYMGAPLTDELDAAGGGRYNQFANGYIHWRPDLGAHTVAGPIAAKWNELGREGLAYPITDTKVNRDQAWFNDFERNGSIYWTPRTGAHLIYGLIRDAWVQRDKRGTKGLCGYPTTDEFQDGRYRRTNFQHGYIRWSRGSGIVWRCTVSFEGDVVLNPVPAD